jgi:hypothetical protein
MHVNRPATRKPDQDQLPTSAAHIRIELEPVRAEFATAPRAARRTAAPGLDRYLADLVIALVAAVLFVAIGHVRRRTPAGGRVCDGA